MTEAEDGVCAALDRFAGALSAQDLAESMATLDETDADLTVIPSEGVDVHRGPHAVRDFLARIYAGPRRYAWQWSDRWVTVHDDMATFVAVGDELVVEDGATTRIPYCLTGAARRLGDSWRLTLLHGSEDATREER